MTSIAVFLYAASLISITGGVSAEPIKGEDRYATCMDMADRSPDKGINLALEWIADGGGIPARHCEAYGLARLGEHAEAAARLMKIAEDMRVGRDMPVRMGKRVVANAAMLADVYDQAANAWLLAGELVRAEDAIALALSLAPKNSQQAFDLTLDHARIAAADGDFELALEGLNKVLKADPGRKDILVLIAAAARGVDDLVQADRVLKDYLNAFPGSAAGYLELGNLRHQQGEYGPARQAWLKVLLLEEMGESAEAARANIEKMDMATSDAAGP